MKFIRIKNTIYLLAIIIFLVNIISYAYSASSDSGSSKKDLYESGKNLVLRAKKLEKKGKIERATKLYLKAYEKLEKAYAKDKKNADVLNYLGFTLRKTGDFKQAEAYYLMGLEIDANHLGINEYLGELYVQTNRLELAKERLAVLKGCNCEEYSELKEIIEKE